MSVELKPAPGPTLRFVSRLVDESYIVDEPPIVGDLLDCFDGVGPPLELLSFEGERMRVRGEDGKDVLLPEDADVYLLDRPTLMRIWDEHLNADAPEGVALQDGLDEKIRVDLNAGIERLMEGRVDYHPGSGTIVRDLVHPSLFPYIDPDFGAAELGAEEVEHVAESQSEQGLGAKLKAFFTRSPKASPPMPTVKPATPPMDLWGRTYEASKYQWLPTPFQVSEDGSVMIEGEINNLPRAEHAPMYDALASLFSEFVPLFESVYGYADELSFYDESLEGEHELPEIKADAKSPAPATPKSLRGQPLQVITKIIEYRLEDAEKFEGVWHVEGMSHENILATGVCVLSRASNLEGGTLRFKRHYTQDDAGALFWNVSQERPTSIEEMVGEVPLGSLDTPEGRLLVFPNCHVHKLSTMSVEGAAGVATRRVVVFWLVHPEHAIKGIGDVPSPQESMSFEEACAARLALMEERRLHKQSHNVRSISLCEH